MRYTIAPEVFSAFPGYVRGVVVAWNCDNTSDSEHLRGLIDAAAAQVASDAALEPVTASPDAFAWRAAFSRFGATPSKFPSALEALLKRAHRGDALPYINDLVALGTYLTLRHRLPTGGHDLNCVSGDLALRMALGDEEFVPLGGGPVERPVPGEVIFCDARQVLCRRWVWRQAEIDKVGHTTTRLVINFDGLPPAHIGRVTAAMDECALLLRDLLGAETRRFILHAAGPGADLGVPST